MTEWEINRKLGARIKRVRHLRDMTQERVARGYRSKSWAAQSHYESGSRAVSVYRLLQLSVILRVEPTCWLLDDAAWEIMLRERLGV